MMQAVNISPKGSSECIIQMHRSTSRDHINITATKELQPLSNEISNSHVFD